MGKQLSRASIKRLKVQRAEALNDLVESVSIPAYFSAKLRRSAFQRQNCGEELLGAERVDWLIAPARIFQK